MLVFAHLKILPIVLDEKLLLSCYRKRPETMPSPLGEYLLAIGVLLLLWITRNFDRLQTRCTMWTSFLVNSRKFSCIYLKKMRLRQYIIEVTIFIIFVSSTYGETDITTRTSLNETSEEVDQEYPEINCPTMNPKHPVFLPHPTNCQKFFICDAGVPYIKICLSGLHFNAKISACDFPANSGCSSSVFTTPKGKDNEEAVLNVACPSESKKHPVLLPHETDCEKFYICSGGIPHLKTCQRGLHFNPKLQVCDFPYRVQCDNGLLAAEGFPSPFCPSINGKYPIFYRHPSNCSVYYMCGNGLAYEFLCPSRLHFNLRKKVCDYEWNAKCQSG